MFIVVCFGNGVFGKPENCFTYVGFKTREDAIAWAEDVMPGYTYWVSRSVSID